MPFVNPGVSSGTKVETRVCKTTKVNSTYKADTTYSGNVVGARNASPVVKTTISGGWRPPTVYRSFAGKVTTYDYNYKYSSGASIYIKDGDTDVRGGIGPPNYIYYGTASSAGLYPAVSDNMVNRSVTEALNKMSASKINIAVSVAEAKTTMNGIAQIVSRIAKSAIHLKRGNIGKALATLTGAKPKRGTSPSNLWLEYQYGIMPLISDLQGAVAALDRGLRKDGHHFSVRRRLTDKIALPPPRSSYDVWKVTGSAHVGVETQLYARIDNRYLDLINSLGLLNPATVLWELTPYSFVIDWLLPIGNVLDAMTAGVGITYKGGYTNKKSWIDFEIECCKQTPLNESDPLPRAKFENVCQYRVTYSSLPIPRLYVKSPFSTSHVISAIALITNLKR